MSTINIYAAPIEPQAVQITNTSGGLLTTGEIIALSTAISMKRLADHLAGDSSRSGLVDAMYDMKNGVGQ